MPLVVLHSGFRFGGWLTTVLAFEFALVILSGVAGALIDVYHGRTVVERIHYGSRGEATIGPGTWCVE